MYGKVMVVEDNDLMRSITARVLRRAGYSVVEATNGVDALSKLDCSEVVLVVTDFHMPYMDGVVFIREMQKLSDCRQVPVVVMSADLEEFKRVCGSDGYGYEWISKPFLSEELVDVVERTVRG